MSRSVLVELSRARWGQVGAEGHVAGVEVAEPGPGLVWSVDCRAFENLL